MPLTLTAGQEEALKVIRSLIDGLGGTVAIINGYAGTGKTTLLKILAEEFPDGLLVVTPTGKASQRVREVAPVNAMTIHRWLYWPVEDPVTGEVRFKLRNDLEPPPYNLVIIDEASMVSRDVWEDLWETCFFMGVNVVAIGDGFQLPPVSKEESFSLLAPDFTYTHVSNIVRVNMTEVVRQALDSPIIRISMAVRESNDFSRALMELPAISEQNFIETGLRVWGEGGAIICHQNKTRHDINADVRKARGLTGLAPGEPLLVLKNNYELNRYNGEVVTLQEIGDQLSKSSTVRDYMNRKTIGVRFIEVKIDDGLKAIIGEEEVLGLTEDVSAKALVAASRKAAWAYYEEVPYPPYLNANFGYCLTAHKSQGSEFPSVLVAVESSIKIFTPNGRRWIYTSLTRTRGQCTLCWR